MLIFKDFSFTFSNPLISSLISVITSISHGYHDTRSKSGIHQINRAILELNAINQYQKYSFYQHPVVYPLLKLDFGNYILCLIKFYIAIFSIIILDILCILSRFWTFCKHFAIKECMHPVNQFSSLYPFLSLRSGTKRYENGFPEPIFSL